MKVGFGHPSHSRNKEPFDNIQPVLESDTNRLYVSLIYQLLTYPHDSLLRVTFEKGICGHYRDLPVRYFITTLQTLIVSNEADAVCRQPTLKHKSPSANFT